MENKSKISYVSKSRDGRTNTSSQDEDELVVTTMTFDVNVDRDGHCVGQQLVPNSEGQAISQSIDSEPPPQSLRRSSNVSTAAANAIINSSLRSDSRDSSNENTESLIERSRKYLNDEAGIIILRKDKAAPPRNFNINLDFDLENQLEQQQATNAGKNFNINLDFDLKNGQITNQPVLITDDDSNVRSPTNTGVDIDLMITRNVVNQTDEARDERVDEIVEEHRE
jgi:hypothetical protein